MDIERICKYAATDAKLYYIVFDGAKAGIYNQYDQAEDAAWYSTQVVTTQKSRQGAITVFKRFHRLKNNN